MTDDAKELAQFVKTEYSYGLLPARQLQPEAFQHPSGALESKKAVLIGLAPMLDDAEKQRKIDVASCEALTRCRIVSKRTRSSWYQYSDLDTSHVIDPSEYQERYLRFLSMSKSSKKPVHNLKKEKSTKNKTNGTYETKDRPVLGVIDGNINGNELLVADRGQKNEQIHRASTDVENSENVVLADELAFSCESKANDTLVRRRDRQREMLSVEHRVSEKKKKRNREVRQEAKNWNEPLGTTTSSVPTTSPCAENAKNSVISPLSSPARKEKSFNREQRRATLSPGQMKTMLELTLADDVCDDIEDKEEIQNSKSISVVDVENASKGAKIGSISPSAVVKEFQDKSDNIGTDICQSDPSFMHCLDKKCLDTFYEEEVVKERPRDEIQCRLYLRLEICRWKYAWEMVSLDACEAASKRNALKSDS